MHSSLIIVCAAMYLRRRLRQNASNVSKIYIGRPIYISNVQYIYTTSGYLYPTTGCLYPTSGCLYPTSEYLYPPISDVRYLYPTSDIQYPTSARAGISDVRYRYRTSDIYIGRPIYILEVRYIYILDVRYRFRKHWWHFVLNGSS